MNKFELVCASVLVASWIAQPAAAGDAAASPTGSLSHPPPPPPPPSGNGAARRSLDPEIAHPPIASGNVPAQVAGAVGYRVYVQAWDPRKPGQDTPTQVANQPAGISSAMNALWDSARRFITDPTNPDSVPSLLGKKDLIAKGVTLYNIKFAVNPLSAIDLQSASGVVYAGQRGSGPSPQAARANAFTLHWKIPGTRLEFKATTPDVVKGIGVSRLLDPDLSAQVDLDITLGLAVSDTAGQSYLQVTDVKVFAQQTKIDSGNLSGDVLVGLTNFLSNTVYGKSFNALLDQVFNDHNLAADPQHSGFAFGVVKTYDLQQMATNYLKPVNNGIAGSGITNYVRMGVWVKPQASGRTLTLLFAPKALPLPPLQGAMTGTVRFDQTIAANRLPTSCAGLLSGNRLDVEVQTGPRTVLDVDPFSYGVAPMQRLTKVVFGGQPQANRACTYTLSGLAPGFANNVMFPPPALATNGSLGQIEQYLRIEPQRWSNPVLPPLAVAPNGYAQLSANGNMAPLANYDLVASTSLAANTGVGAMQANPAEMARGPTNPGDPATRWGTQTVTKGQTAAQRAGQPQPSALGGQVVQPASTGPKWGTPGTAPAAGVAHPASQPAHQLGQPATVPSSLGTTEARP